mmetsp:Transcript_11191/g.27101  ORF Transcript_11191/g.27101 Transcript_11191/m.27101 type:complete len:282 (+) Transcript_11191:346-1191(+)
MLLDTTTVRMPRRPNALPLPLPHLLFHPFPLLFPLLPLLLILLVPLPVSVAGFVAVAVAVAAAVAPLAVVGGTGWGRGYTRWVLEGLRVAGEALEVFDEPLVRREGLQVPREGLALEGSELGHSLVGVSDFLEILVVFGLGLLHLNLLVRKQVDVPTSTTSRRAHSLATIYGISSRGSIIVVLDGRSSDGVVVGFLVGGVRGPSPFQPAYLAHELLLVLVALFLALLLPVVILILGDLSLVVVSVEVPSLLWQDVQAAVTSHRQSVSYQPIFNTQGAKKGR